MPQTLLALLAMVLASLVSFSQQRNALSTYETMLQNEIELAATGTIMHVIELVGGRSFDERSTPEGIRAAGTLPSGPEAFSAISAFGSTDRGAGGCNLDAPYLAPDCDDIDDVDGLRDVVVNALLADGRTLPFTVDVDVDYVTEDDVQASSSTPTRNKRVVVTARNALLPGGQIVVERVFAYDWIKAEMNYETVYGPLGT